MRAGARLWYSQMLQAAGSTANPRNSPRVLAGSGAADRVLLLGNGVLHGWGVQLRELAVPGQLAELLQMRTGRAALVDFVGEERMNAASAVDWLGSAAARGHDVAVVAIGLNDALRLTPLPDWRRDMTAVVRRILDEQHADAALLLVGVPHVRAFTMANSVMGSIAQRHADQLNQVLREIAADVDRVVFVEAPVEQFEPDRPLGSSEMYRAWAAQLLPPLLAALERVRAEKPVAAEIADAWDWNGTSAALGSDGSAVQQRFEALTESVRERYGVAMVGINVLDGDQVYSIAGRGGGPRQLPRSLAYCDRTVTRDEPTLIPDADLDPEFAGNPFIDVVGLPFYAGMPLHASDGRPVATLCLLDSEPRADIDPEQLRPYAEIAETMLRDFEVVQPSTPAREPAEARTGDQPRLDGRPLWALAWMLRPVVDVALSGFLRRQARPHWDNRAISPGPRPLRVLVFGAGFAVGYGSDGADDPLPAALAAALAEATGRGVIVETRARPSVALEHCLALLGRSGAATFDHVVWCPTLEEVTRSGYRWSRQLTRIITALHVTGLPHMSLTLLGLPLVEGDHPLHRIGQVLGSAVNRRIEDAASAHPTTTFLPIPSRTIPTYDTPFFDTAYRSEVTALLARHLLSGQRSVLHRITDEHRTAQLAMR